MAIRQIIQYPDERLHKLAKPVLAVTADIRRLIDDMAETMYAAPGVGLAASQVDVHLRIIVIDVSEDHGELNVFVNPEIIERRGECEREEGCLSLPGVYDKVSRSQWIRVRA
ncbi:MAG: peptide deformylase, partial [Burkholderiales bacterium]|nr:peptide deformylase [Burkholderiales bacterium]